MIVVLDNINILKRTQKKIITFLEDQIYSINFTIFQFCCSVDNCSEGCYDQIKSFHIQRQQHVKLTAGVETRGHLDDVIIMAS